MFFFYKVLLEISQLMTVSVEHLLWMTQMQNGTNHILAGDRITSWTAKSSAVIKEKNSFRAVLPAVGFTRI